MKSIKILSFPKSVIGNLNLRKKAVEVPDNDLRVRRLSIGFTLIELLVVVLVIGILAVIAVPQYQRAVDKARYMQGVMLVEHVWQAEQVYKLANGDYSKSFADLDIEMPVPVSSGASDSDRYYYDWGDCVIHDTGYIACKVKTGDGRAWYFASPGYSSRQCWAQPADNARANRLCKIMTQKTTGDTSGIYTIYQF